MVDIFGWSEISWKRSLNGVGLAGLLLKRKLINQAHDIVLDLSLDLLGASVGVLAIL